MHHHYERQLTTKQKKLWHFTFPPIAVSLMLGLCHTFARPEPLAVPGCHKQLETLGACFPKVLLWSQKCWHKFSAGRKPENSSECWESSPACMMQCTKEWWKLQFRISLQGKKNKTLNTIKRPHCVIKWGFADREERDWLGKQLKASNTQLLRECHGLKPNSQEKVFKHLVIGCLCFSCAASSPPKELYTLRLITCLHSERLTGEKFWS